MALIHKGKQIKTAGFLGFGKSNEAVYNYLKKNYPKTVLTAESKRGEKIPAGLFAFSGNEDAVFVSPSLRREGVAPRSTLSSDIEFFFEKNETTAFLVTGSDGKSTTTALAEMILKKSGVASRAIGNIGVPFTEALGSRTQAFVCEASSFQLNYFQPKTKRALITNITENHLDWHENFEEYINAKENGIRNTEEAVLFCDSPIMCEVISRNKPYAVVSHKLTEGEIKRFSAQTFVYIKDSSIHLNGKPVLPLERIRLKGEYNIKNFMGAIALTEGFSNNEAILSASDAFEGLPHRLKLIGIASGVKFYDSSIDTSPARTLATLSAINEEYVLILGGKSKMKNFEILKEQLRKNAHALVLTGENRYEIKDSLSDLDIPFFIAESFDFAVDTAFKLAKNTSSVLLSPASQSYDKFKSFEERADAFLKAFLKIKTKLN